MDNEEVKEFIAAYEACDRRRIQLAYRAGIKLCVLVFEKYNKLYRDYNEGKQPHEIEAFETAKCCSEMQALLDEQYTDAAPEPESEPR